MSALPEPIEKLEQEKPRSKTGAQSELNGGLAFVLNNITNNIVKHRKGLNADDKGVGVQAADLALVIVQAAIQEEMVRLAQES